MSRFDWSWGKDPFLVSLMWLFAGLGSSRVVGLRVSVPCWPLLEPLSVLATSASPQGSWFY